MRRPHWSANTGGKCRQVRAVWSPLRGPAGQKETREDDEAEKGPRQEKEGNRGVCGERRKKRVREGQCLIAK